MVDSRSWTWPPVSPVFCCWWTNLCIMRFFTFKAVRVCSYFLHKHKPCLWSLALSPVTHMTGLFWASHHTSKDWNWAEPSCQQQPWEAAEMPDGCPLQAVRCRRSHATPSSLWKHYTIEASKMSFRPPDRPASHPSSWDAILCKANV